MAKSKSNEEVILEGLQKALDALPDLLPLSGTKAIFSSKQAALADRAVREGLLTTRKRLVTPPRGRAKEVVVGVLTETGVRKLHTSRQRRK